MESGGDMLTPFGKLCRKIRIDHDELMEDMARKLDVTTSYLSAVERGKRKVPIEWSNIIAENYKLTEVQIQEFIHLTVIDRLTKKEYEALSEAA